MEKRGTPQYFANMKLSAMLLRMVYPTVLTDFANHMELSEVKERLFRIGKRSGEQLFEYFKVKGNKIEKIIKEIFKKIWDSKVKIRKEEDGDVLFLETKDCPVCGDLPPLELEDLHYCIPVAGFLEGYLNELAKIRYIGIKGSIKVDTIQSICTQESESCIHKLVITGGPEL